MLLEIGELHGELFLRKIFFLKWFEKNKYIFSYELKKKSQDPQSIRIIKHYKTKLESELEELCKYNNKNNLNNVYKIILFWNNSLYKNYFYYIGNDVLNLLES